MKAFVIPAESWDILVNTAVSVIKNNSIKAMNLPFFKTFELWSVLGSTYSEIAKRTVVIMPLAAESSPFKKTCVKDKIPKPGLDRWLMCRRASSVLSVAKKIQRKLTRQKFSTIFTGFGRWLRIFLTKGMSSNSISRPWPKPHSINFSPAPCHIPLITNTNRVLKAVRTAPLRFPPRGMYI